MGTLKSDGENYSLPLLYSDERTKEGQSKAAQSAKAYFPDLPTVSCNALYMEAQENKWTDQEFIDRVKHVARTCKYPKPTLSNFLDFTNGIKLLTWHQWINLQRSEMNQYKPIRIHGRTKPLWANKGDIETYKLELFNNGD